MFFRQTTHPSWLQFNIYSKTVMKYSNLLICLEFPLHVRTRLSLTEETGKINILNFIVRGLEF